MAIKFGQRNHLRIITDLYNPRPSTMIVQRSHNAIATIAHCDTLKYRFQEKNFKKSKNGTAHYGFL